MNAIRGPMLIPRRDRSVEWIPDGVMRWDDAGIITAIGAAGTPGLRYSEDPDPTRQNPGLRSTSDAGVPASRGVICPPFLDLHTHIPQWPIRGHFCDGVGDHPDGGRLIAGLNRNVFPAEGRCDSTSHAEAVVASFAADTLAHGVVGGAAFMTVHAPATEIALARLPALWSVGLVLMNQNCPDYLRTNEANLERDVTRLAERFGKRFIVTDRFAVAVDSPLRRRGVALAERFDLRMQTHLNEQVAEKRFVEDTLYPGRGSYTAVYESDGLLDRRAILAHCVQMSDAEFDLAASHGCVIAHCPTSNAALDSGVMPLDAVLDRGIPYAICTDVGASPTTSILAEMSVFLTTHAGRSPRATAVEALFRTTLGAAEILGVADRVGDLSVGRPASFIEVEAGPVVADDAGVEAVIRGRLLGWPDVAERREAAAIAGLVPGVSANMDWAVNRVTVGGAVVRKSQL